MDRIRRYAAGIVVPDHRQSRSLGHELSQGALNGDMFCHVEKISLWSARAQTCRSAPWHGRSCRRPPHACGMRLHPAPPSWVALSTLAAGLGSSTWLVSSASAQFGRPPFHAGPGTLCMAHGRKMLARLSASCGQQRLLTEEVLPTRSPHVPHASDRLRGGRLVRKSDRPQILFANLSPSMSTSVITRRARSLNSAQDTTPMLGATAPGRYRWHS